MKAFLVILAFFLSPIILVAAIAGWTYFQDWANRKFVDKHPEWRSVIAAIAFIIAVLLFKDIVFK